jgi:PTH1 family peptidyl-tRNA hydrolase
MKLIVGLGNPGTVYQKTRHNIGSEAVKFFAKQHKAVLKKGLFSPALSNRLKIAGKEVILAVPLVFMNLSGVAVAALVKKHRVSSGDLLVVLDDLDLELGRIKIKSDGSAGGHNGIKSIISSLRREDFCRLRLGIGRPKQGSDISGYVLSDFLKKDIKTIESLKENASQAMELWLKEGVSKTMNVFNR